MWPAVALRLQKCACDQRIADIKPRMIPWLYTGPTEWPIMEDWVGLAWESLYPVKWLLFHSCHCEIHYLLSPASSSLWTCYFCFHSVTHAALMFLFLWLFPCFHWMLHTKQVKLLFNSPDIMLFESPSNERWTMIITLIKVHHWTSAKQVIFAQVKDLNSPRPWPSSNNYQDLISTPWSFQHSVVQYIQWNKVSIMICFHLNYFLSYF